MKLYFFPEGLIAQKDENIGHWRSFVVVTKVFGQNVQLWKNGRVDALRICSGVLPTLGGGTRSLYGVWYEVTCATTCAPRFIVRSKSRPIFLFYYGFLKCSFLPLVGH